MNHYFVYHNEEKMKKSIIDIGELRGVTNNSVAGTEGGMAWVVSGVGSSNTPKRYFLSAYFIITREKMGSSPYPEFSNSIEGDSKAGKILNPAIEITHMKWLESLKKETNNFYGFQKIRSTSTIKELQSLVK